MNSFKKSDLPNVGKLIRQGSKVMIVDGSYTLSISANEPTKLKHYPVGLSNDLYTVVAVNVDCPTDTDDDSLTYRNNCIIRNDAGDIVFCSKINIRNIESI